MTSPTTKSSFPILVGASTQYSSVKEIYLLRQAGGAGEAGVAGGEKKA
ncbi:hypothetical protein [Nostoc sp. CHAB 5715]|nr:hypothetical protein [Nostoc sp. CHAB 5715]MCC5620351.1 hypothetical protein [Nostoc sp. CHAB 5715]